ncbi:caspase-1-like isoform 1 [Leptotrombidium deliense]|uniref:Caspase-1-like isoform 1 n=1 Tax=Leptotrombidium deliense TaxID=299467 RepID=A0A443SEF9_9ACAR|nr:caspase-1-like isoform 1 [Leptotrombidium deliense]
MNSKTDDPKCVDVCENDISFLTDGVKTVLQLEKECDPEYTFSNGLCLIFNHEVFDEPDIPQRVGTNVDRDNLIVMFAKKLGFAKENVKVFQDYSRREIEDCLNEYASDSCDVKFDCLVCFVLTRGNKDTLFARDRPYRNDLIHTKFKTSAHFTKLRGKPKLFFYVACQGPKHDEGIEIQFDSANIPFVPENDDFLLVLSSVPGFKNRRYHKKGTVYVRYLLKALEASIAKKLDNQINEDIQEILTTANRLVAYKYEGVDKYTKKTVKQMPIFFSTFKHDFFITRNAQT